MISLLTQDQIQYLYNLLDKSLEEDNYDLTCIYCEYGKLQMNCRAKFCNELKRTLQLMMES